MSLRPKINTVRGKQEQRVQRSKPLGQQHPSVCCLPSEAFCISEKHGRFWGLFFKVNQTGSHRDDFSQKDALRKPSPSFGEFIMFWLDMREFFWWTVMKGVERSKWSIRRGSYLLFYQSSSSLPSSLIFNTQHFPLCSECVLFIFEYFVNCSFSLNINVCGVRKRSVALRRLGLWDTLRATWTGALV